VDSVQSHKAFLLYEEIWEILVLYEGGMYSSSSLALQPIPFPFFNSVNCSLHCKVCWPPAHIPTTPP
jgi:hypothetical protein